MLRTIRGGDEGGFVPGLAVLVAVIMAVGGIIVLIYFIHHIATSIQASNIVASVTMETLAAVDRLYPWPAEPGETEERVTAPGSSWIPIKAGSDGYIERMDFAGLDELAREFDVTLRTEHAVGDFVIKGTPLLSVWGPVSGDRLEGAAMGMIHVARLRTVEQDVGFGIRQLADIALRALSPGINDTTTAIMCIDYLTAVLSRLAPRCVGELPPRNGVPRRVIAARPQTFGGFLGRAFDQIREAGSNNIAVLTRLAEGLDTVSRFAAGPDRQRVVVQHAALLKETAERDIANRRDRQHVLELLTRIGSSPAF